VVDLDEVAGEEAQEAEAEDLEVLTSIYSSTICHFITFFLPGGSRGFRGGR